MNFREINKRRERQLWRERADSAFYPRLGNEQQPNSKMTKIGIQKRVLIQNNIIPKFQNKLVRIKPTKKIFKGILIRRDFNIITNQYVSNNAAKSKIDKDRTMALVRAKQRFYGNRNPILGDI